MTPSRPREEEEQVLPGLSVPQTVYTHPPTITQRSFPSFHLSSHPRQRPFNARRRHSLSLTSPAPLDTLRSLRPTLFSRSPRRKQTNPSNQIKAYRPPYPPFVQTTSSDHRRHSLNSSLANVHHPRNVQQHHLRFRRPCGCADRPRRRVHHQPCGDDECHRRTGPHRQVG